MYVQDFYARASKILGSCDQTTIFQGITDAVRRLANKSIIDPSVASMDICAYDGCITLPSDVGTILTVNVGGHPTLIRDEWFHSHLNGPGDDECHPCDFTDELGMHCTLKEPSAPVYLVCELDSAADNNKQVRVFGWDVDGKRIWTPDANGNMQDGFLVPTIYGNPTRTNAAPPIARFDRIHKDPTNGFIKLTAVDQNTLQGHTLIGYYQPNETDPKYRRIRVKGQSWVRVRYKKANPNVTSMNDWVPVDNYEALGQFLKAVKYSSLDRNDLSEAAEAVGEKLINDEAQAKRPKNVLSGPQIIYSDWPADRGERLFY